jgi:hypothetical protein
LIPALSASQIEQVDEIGNIYRRLKHEPITHVDKLTALFATLMLLLTTKRIIRLVVLKKVITSARFLYESLPGEVECRHHPPATECSALPIHE